tara:strand:- start:4753 stop:5337 length:585 start_codon:yes stop_codon:yes gene_type:complete
MAINTLVLKANVCVKDGCKKVSVTDVTGEYNASTNVGGWGAINSARTEITAATITITDSAGTVTTETVTSQVNPVAWYQDFTFNDIDVTLADGLHTLEYSVTNASDTPSTVTASIKFYTYCTIKCCIEKKVHAAIVAYGNDPCKHADKLNYANYLWALLKDFEKAASGCNFNKAKTAFDKLTALCAAKEDCSCK